MTDAFEIQNFIFLSNHFKIFFLNFKTDGSLIILTID